MKFTTFLTLALSTTLLNALDTSGSVRRRMPQVATENRQDDATMALEQNANMENMVKIMVTNEAFQQPFGPFFVMTHNGMENPLFKVGSNATKELAFLAENGDPSMLVNSYNASTNVGYLGAVTEGVPFVGGETLTFMVPYDVNYPYLSIASMAINTNDCFVALNGVKIEAGAVFEGPGFDSGSEENNELCNSIPGPACADADTAVTRNTNEASGNGEGFVHIHRGFFGVGDLSASGYDWRNPMMRVEMKM